MGILRTSVVAWWALFAGVSVSAAHATEPGRVLAQQFHLRNRCSDAAQNAFRSRWGHVRADRILLGFTSHYDVKTNRCYLLVTYREGKLTWFDVSDAQSGATQARFRIDPAGTSVPSVPAVRPRAAGAEARHPDTATRRPR